MFVLKKAIAALLYPLPICLILLMVGVMLLWRDGGRVWGRRFVTAGVLLLLVFSFKPVPDLAVHGLEGRHEVFAPARYAGVPVRWVVVLGGGVTDDPSLPPNGQVSATSLARLVEGLRVLRFYPEARLLLSGGGYFSQIPEAEALLRVAAMLGVDASRVVVESRSVNTADQAAKVHALVGDDPLVLVTSAVHLPRSMALFEAQGMAPLPAPARHLRRRSRRLSPSAFAPTTANLSKLSAAWHEYLGWLWAALRGRA